MKPIRVFILFCVGSLFLTTRSWASEAQLKEGNRLFRAGRYDAALKNYNDALIDTPDSSILHFDAGDAAYQTGDFSTAEKQFEEAGDRTPLPPLRAAARYNQGNALFRQSKWADAVEAYKEALRSNPRDEDAKYNLGLAMQNQKNPSRAPKQPKPEHGQNGKQKNNQGSGQNQPPEAKKPQPGEMSKEDAERLLAAAGAGEPKKPNAQAAKPGVPHPDEDW